MEKLRYLPVEDKEGKLVGFITSRTLIKYFANHDSCDPDTQIVSDIMITDVITITPDANIMTARNVMQENQVGGLPVVLDGELVGIITETDFVNITVRLLDRLAEEE